jgi:WD40 repeat protein
LVCSQMEAAGLKITSFLPPELTKPTAKTTENSVSLENPSSLAVAVKLVGPSAQAVNIPSGKTSVLRAVAGEYSILMRYGSGPDDYRFAKGGPFKVVETDTQHSVVKIALPKLPPDSPGARSEFEAAVVDVIRSPSPSAPRFQLGYVLTGAGGGEVFTVSFSKNGGSLVSTSYENPANDVWENAVRIWDVSTGREITTFRKNYGVTGALSADGRWIASHEGSTLKVLDFAGNSVVRSLPIEKKGGTFAFVPNDKGWIAIADRTIKIYHVRTGQMIRELRSEDSVPLSMDFSADGRWLAAGGAGKAIHIWDVSTGQMAKRLETTDKSLVLSPDGRWLASFTLERRGPAKAKGKDTGKAITIWEVATGRTVQTLGITDRAVVFSPDGRWATSRLGNVTTIWEVATGSAVQTLNGYGSAVAFSPDGQWIAFGPRSQIEIWDIATAQKIQTVGGQQNSTNAVTFSPDGRLLAVAGSGNSVWLWKRTD